MQTLIVFSHLRWDFVFQRPQHLLSRLAKDYRILYFEEPVRGKQTPFLQRFTPCPNVEVLRPHTTVDAIGFHDEQLPELKPLLAEYLSDFSIDDYLVWFYTPMALPLLAELQPRAVIYDCMDELSAFKGAPRQMVQRESALMKRAQLVLTGGPSLYGAKRALHDNVHCFPSAVDADHFAPSAVSRNVSSGGVSSPHISMPSASTSPGTERKPSRFQEEAARLHAGIARPRLGFFGVIDERFDLELLTAVADAAPEWQLVMVGPVVKIDPASLPQHPNVHWLGQQPYEILPHLVAQWDVCLLLFARNESTRFISPTKTLEYMAAEKPIVSTPIHDVVSLYGNCVSIAHTASAFVSACADALREIGSDREQRLERMRAHISQCTWDGTARQVRAQIEAVLQREYATESVSAHRFFRPAAAQPVETLRGSAANRITADVERASVAAS
jgi:glycosyltransferase involved in cell wall biosynthesis